jgi:hypothetical protein
MLFLKIQQRTKEPLFRTSTLPFWNPSWNTAERNFSWNTISLPCFCKLWETMLFFQGLMQEWQETGCNILFMTRHTHSVLHRERWRFLISGYPACFVSYRSPCSHEVLAGLRALTKKFISLKQKKAILQKCGFLGSLLAPIVSAVSSFVNIIYHCRAFSSDERPCYSLSVWCKSDKKRDATGRSHGRNGSKGGFTVYEKESPQKHQRHVHRSESVSP